MSLQSIIQSIVDIPAKLLPKKGKSIQDLQSDSSKNPDDVRLKLKLAETFYKNKKNAEAIKVYSEMADNYLAQNFPLKAAHILKTILKIDPKQVDIYLKLADLYLKEDLKPDAANELRIALNTALNLKNADLVFDVGKKLVEIDPSALNLRKLAEIYQAHGMMNEALNTYNRLAHIYRSQKDFESLLHIYEMLLAHNPTNNNTMIRDVCILYLRKKDPEGAIRALERYKVDQSPEFAEIKDKIDLMKKALKAEEEKKKG